jgi:hypothetical protein
MKQIGKSQLEIALGEKAENVINCVELETRGAKIMLTEHYTAECFKDKPDSYWDKQFIIDYSQWESIVGIRNPKKLDEYTLVSLAKCLIDEYPYFNEKSVVIALKMNLKGIKWQRIEAYDLLNESFLIRVLENYQIELNNLLKRANEIKNKLMPEKELTFEEKEAQMVETIRTIFKERKENNHLGTEMLSHPIYDILVAKGLINLSIDEKKALRDEATPMLKATKANGVSATDYITIMRQFNEGKLVNEVALVAKVLAVRDYFNSIETLEL